ncbi:hypothetical protein [Stenotrophomonas sp. SORGH_AS_0282]|uniref:hypothetical protein n=1 Tax=Stenotrophomonas sp. SORGH_AS_0282 TaxID=3041763 RepID=UPI0027D8F610|nr:hypothetical protein [Stenotrophomonas sp. SORGH_AS_0282]
MASRRFKWTAAGSTVAAIGLAIVGYSLIAAQGKGVLAQEPLASKTSAPASFIMAVDDSGSMNFQTQFPGRDGEGCWNTTRQSFFDANGQLYTSGNCDYFFVVPGPRINNYYGIPPINSLGFARSAAYNPSYYDPTVTYEPWAKSGLEDYLPSSPTAALINLPAQWRHRYRESGCQLLQHGRQRQFPHADGHGDSCKHAVPIQQHQLPVQHGLHLAIEQG